MCLAHRAQPQPCAAAFVADGKSPPADRHAQTIAAQRFTDAAGTGCDDRSGPSFVCAEQRRIGVGVQCDFSKRRRAAEELFATLSHIGAGETEAQRALLASGGCLSCVSERAVDGLLDVVHACSIPWASADGPDAAKPSTAPSAEASRARVCVPPPSTPM